MRRSTAILSTLLGAALALWLWSRTQSGQDVLASASDWLGNLMTPRGIRNNNPGNIERNSIEWDGAMSPDQVAAAGLTWDPTFVQFSDPSYGVRAIGHVLRSDAARGLTTVDQLIRSYSATDQDAYVANVSAALGVAPTDEIDVYGQLPQLAAAIIQQEEGQQPYAASDVASWVYS